MDTDNWKNYIVDLRFMKTIGLYQILNPNTPKKPFGCNVFKLAGALSLIYLTFVNVMCCVSIYYAMGDFAEVVKYTMLLFAISFAFVKLYFVIRKSNSLWEFMCFTRIDFLSYSGHQRDILIDARKESVMFSKIFTLGWSAIILLWILSPLMIQGNVVNVKSKDGTSYSQYRYNTMNLIFPAVTAEFYNDNFRIFYSIEVILILVYGYVMVVFDCLVISMCITMIYQLKMIALSYINLGHNGTKMDFKSEFYILVFITNCF